MKLLKDLEAARETAILLLTLKVPYPPLCGVDKELKPVFMLFLIFLYMFCIAKCPKHCKIRSRVHAYTQPQ